MKENNYNQVILDSHVHFYQSWDISLDQLLSTTYDNLNSNLHGQLDSKTLAAVCILDTVKSEKSIVDLLYQLHLNRTSTWKVTPLEQEPFAFWASKEDRKLLVITGTQFNSSEGLEVLTIGQYQAVNHGDSITQMLKLSGQNSLTILPWAVGKWLGKRGSIIVDRIENQNVNQFVLGDNGGRPWFWTHIKPFKLAKKKNLAILSGSDPLPVPDGYLKSGSFGSIVSASISRSTPWASIVESIDPKHITHVGKPSSSIEFFKNQIMLRI